MYHDCDTSEMGASRFAVRDVHRIGILDIRIWNTDRHAGNILVRRSRESALNLSGLARLDSAQMELVPIDHGFCLPEALEPPYFEWLHWPQVCSPQLLLVNHWRCHVMARAESPVAACMESSPLYMDSINIREICCSEDWSDMYTQAMIPFSEDELDYIARLDAAADKELLRQELPSLREESLRTLEVATTLLQRCAAAGVHTYPSPILCADMPPSLHLQTRYAVLNQ